MTLKRKYEALTDRNNTLESLLALLRDASSLDAGAALGRIRAGASVEDVLHSVVEGDPVIESPSERTGSGSASASTDDNTVVQQVTHRQLSRSHSTSSVRDRMNVHSLLAAGSSSGISPERQEASANSIPIWDPDIRSAVTYWAKREK
ncbi:hypothetical protein ANO11243_032450 [Dothideomycetidae sp. 11243]|nr:hypothetical protein ANO11243_032450 [fungal sp. No.11243]